MEPTSFRPHPLSRNWKCGGGWTHESLLGGHSNAGLITSKDRFTGLWISGNIRRVSAMQIANQPKQEDLTDPGAGTLGVTPKPGCLKGFRMSADFDDPLEGFDDGMLLQNTNLESS